MKKNAKDLAKVSRAMSRIRTFIAHESKAMSTEEYRCLLEELAAEAEAWEMQLDEGDESKD